MDKKYNLSILESQYHKTGLAHKGYKQLKALIETQKYNELENLLRYHTSLGIHDKYELDFRKNVDCLLDFYGILFTAIVSEYVPHNLTPRLKNEIVFILDNPIVKIYYTEHYALFLPTILLTYVKADCPRLKISYNDQGRKERELFERFLLINEELNNDSDITSFLWLLDDGRLGSNDYSIDNLVNTLQDKELIRDIVNRGSRKSSKAISFRGYIKYLNYLKDYVDLLRESHNDIYLYSAFYHHQGYWFYKMKGRMGDSMLKGIKNLQYVILNQDRSEFEAKFSVSQSNTTDNAKYLSDKGRTPAPYDFSEWMESSQSELRTVEDNILYLRHAQADLAVMKTVFE